MGVLHEMKETLTAKDLAKLEGVTVRAINTRWNANFRGQPFDSNAELSPEQVAKLREAGKRKIRKQRAQQPGGKPAAASKPISTPPAPRPVKKQTALLFVPLIAATAASVGNMYHITRALAGSAFDAWLLTSVLSTSALCFILAGMRSAWTIALAVLLIAFESFCNLTRIYGGLMGTGTTGNPTRFLGLCTDIFNSGSHGTAVALGAFTAFFIAAVQYAAVFQLNRK